MDSKIITQTIEALIGARDFKGIRDQIKNWTATDLADLMEPLDVEQEVILFRLLPRELAAKVFSYLSPEMQEELLKGMAREEIASILNAMSPDDRTSLLEEMPAQAIQHMLSLLTNEERAVASNRFTGSSVLIRSGSCFRSSADRDARPPGGCKARGPGQSP